MDQNAPGTNLPNRRRLSYEQKIHFPGSYPFYTGKEFTSESLKDDNVDPRDISEVEEFNEENKTKEMNEKGFEEDKSGDDLDVPGSELDDEQEKVGSEDEENNFYSIGGDEHNDLEEDKGE